MKLKPASALFLALALPAASAVASAEPAAANSSRPIWEEIFLEGKFSFDLRLRYEFANQSGLDESHALTARTRLGYGTNIALPISGYIELEDIRALDGDAYNQAGLNNQPGKTVIADPETTELNQAFLRLRHGSFDSRVGRQRIILDNHRFIGNVGWRQNEQTFDAVYATYQPATATALTAGYIERVNRVFGREHPQGRWDSESYFGHVRAPLPGNEGAMGAYVYLLRLDDAPAVSGDTFGLWVRPELAVAEHPLRLHLELARQVDNHANPAAADFSVTYFRVEAQTDVDRFGLTAGYELLGSDRNFAVQTPLATLHAFNGWTDQFLVTPAAGLQDIYAHVSAKLPASVNGRVGYHYFTSHRESITYGQEVNAQLTRRFGQHLSALVKAAYFDGREGRPDVTKAWVQTEITF